MNKEQRIQELLELLSEAKDKTSFAYLQGLNSLKTEYELANDVENACKYADIIIDLLVEQNVTYNEVHTNKVNDILVHAYDTKARNGDFDAYCIALEWNRPLDKKYYLPRRRVLKKHGVIQAFQDANEDLLDLLVLNMPPRVGKQLSDDTPILTRHGWKKHGDIVPGDYVLNHKGQYVKVLATSEKSKSEYRVTFSNGEQIDCHGNHEWVVYDRHARKEKTVETNYMIGHLKDAYCDISSKNHYRFLLPQKEFVKGEYEFLPVDPYTFGAWLGDGTNTNPYITGDKKDRAIIDSIEKNGYALRHVWINDKTGAYTYDFNGLRESLQCLGMCHSRYTVEKHIPVQYLIGSIDQRLELLAGLLDTDGSLRKKEHRYSFTTCEKQLRDDFITLVNTFGWRTSCVEYQPKKSSSGIIGRKKYWVISFNPTIEIPCRLERKQLKEFSKPRRISIIDIQPLKEEKYGNCIQVEGGIYLAGRQLIPTHNSTIGLFFLTQRAGMYPDLSILGSGHSTQLTQSFYLEFVEILTSEEYRFKEIFNKCTLVNKNNEYSFLDLNSKKRFHTVTFRSIDAGTTGSVEASNVLYCDDFVKDAEEANNKDRLDNKFGQYTSSIKDRKVQKLCKDGVYRPCLEIHINTPWSLYDVTNRVINAEREKGNMDRVRIISIPCWNENHESNFVYDYGKGFDVRYYEDMEAVEDPVIFSAKYLMKCIERDGRPFERDNLTYYTELPGYEPDRIVAYNDVAHGGDDFMSMPIAYVYGTEVYIEDVLFIHNFEGDNVSRPLVCKKIIEHNISRCGFEKNNGGDFFASMIDGDLKNKGYRCNITSHNAPTRQRKLDRILACQSEIMGIGNDLGNNYRIYFKDPTILPKNCEYREFLNNLWNWSQKEGTVQKKQHDDAPDSLSGLISNILGKRGHATVKVMDIGTIGY